MSGTTTATSMDFTHLPSNIRVPGVYFDFDPSNANNPQQQVKALIIGQVLTGSAWAATGLVNAPALSLGYNDARANAGYGSQLAQMVGRFKARYSFGELWVLPIIDDPAAVAATGTVVFAGTPTASGTISLYIDAQLVSVLDVAGTTAAQAATNLVAAAALLPDLPVTLTASGATVTATAKNKGAAGNDLDIRLNYYGVVNNETLPAGRTATITPMASGTTNPSLTTPLLALADLPFEVIVSPFTDAASLNALGLMMNDSAGRWSWTRKKFGQVYASMKANLSQASTFGATRNDQHVSILPISNCPLSPPECAADYAAAVMERVSVDPALPLQYMPTNIPPPFPVDRFAIADRNTLLFDGLSTYKVVSGVLETERLCTNYQYNTTGAPDTSYLDCETMHTLGFVCRDLDSYLSAKFATKKLTADTTAIPGGSSLVNPALIKATLDTRYRTLCDSLGWCQDAAGFAKESRVEIAGLGRVNIYAPLRLMGQLRILAVLAAFYKPT